MYSRLAWILYHAKRNTDAEHAYRDFFARFAGQYDSEETRTLLHNARLRAVKHLRHAARHGAGRGIA